MLWRPGRSVAVDAVTAVAGVAVVLGAAAFVWAGGYPPGSSAGGRAEVQVGPGLPLTGAGGLLLAAAGISRLRWRRGGSRRPG